MIELWSHPACESCEDAKKYLQKTPLEWKYVQIGTSFTGVIPRLVLENGEHIIGFPAIKTYIKKWMKNMGFTEMI